MTKRLSKPILKAQEPGAPADPKLLVAALLAKRSSGGRQRAGWVGDAIYAANDGLGGIFGIVSGVAGATFGNRRVVLLAGLSGVIASAMSSGVSAYLAAKGDREIYEAGVSEERDAIASNRTQARELLSMYFQTRGLPLEDADSIVMHLEKNPHQLLRSLAMMRLHSSEEALLDPLTSALSCAISTAIGAFVTIIPFFFFGGFRALVWVAVVSLAAHFAVGAAKSLITVRSWWSGGLELSAIGAAEGVITYVLGIGIGRIALH